MVINLDRRSDRLQNFEEALSRSQPWLLDKICRVEGRDGKGLSTKGAHRSSLRLEHDVFALRKSLSPESETRAVPHHLHGDLTLVADGWVTAEALSQAEHDGPLPWPSMTAGGLGLYLSHAAAWDHVVEKDLDYGVIFEDDLTLFAAGFKDQVSSILERRKGFFSPAWDWLYLQQCNDAAWTKRRAGGLDLPRSDWSARARKVKGVKGRGSSRWSASVPINATEVVPCTGAYIITRRGAEKLLEGALPAKQQLDRQLGSVPDLRRVVLTPPLAQCEEVVVKGGWEYRDTDVQQAFKRKRHSLLGEKLSGDPAIPDCGN